MAGVATPDHTIRTKNYPLIVPRAGARRARRFRRRGARRRSSASSPTTTPISRATTRRRGGIKRELDPMPRVILVPGLGLFGLGRSAKDAAIAADLAESWVADRDRRRGGRHVRVAARGRTVRDGILVAGAGQARRRGRKAARRPGRGRHRRRRHDRPGDGTRAARRGRRDRAARPRRGRPGSRREEARRARHRLRRDRPARGRAPPSSASSRASAASTSSSPMPARPGRAGSARSTDATLRESFELNFFAHQSVAQQAVQDHAGAADRRLPAVQRVEAGGEPGRRFRPLRPAEGGDPGADAAIRARIRRRRHPRQRRQRRPHPRRPAHRCDDRRPRHGPRRQRGRLHGRQPAAPRGDRRGRGGGLCRSWRWRATPPARSSRSMAATSPPRRADQPKPIRLRNSRVALAHAAGASSCSKWPVPGIAR